MKRVAKVLAMLAGLTLVLTACPSGDTDGDDGKKAAASVLQTVKDRGTVICGVNNSVPGFGFVDESGAFKGFDIDFCKALAAAVFGDATKVQFKALTAEQRFTSLQSNEIDVLIRNTTYTATRDGKERAQFATTTFYDGQGMMVKADSDLNKLEDLDGETICVLSGTTTELNLESVFKARDIKYEPQSLESVDQIQEAFTSDRCRGWTSDKSQLAGIRSNFPANKGGPDGLRILQETMSKEPLGPVVLEGDADWFDVVNWTVFATIQAEELGITSKNVDSFLTSDSPEIKRFLGRATVTSSPSAASGSPTASPVTSPFDAGLGLSGDFAVNIIKAVGNYGEIYRRNVGPGTPLGLARGLNDLWFNGGLLYSPPFR
jgi:general L-amino acid transport system substrate-binding protein